MALAYSFPQAMNNLYMNPSNVLKTKPTTTSIIIINQQSKQSINQTKKKCLRCKTLYQDKNNSPTACSFHGHTTGPCYITISDDTLSYRINGGVTSSIPYVGVSEPYGVNAWRVGCGATSPFGDSGVIRNGEKGLFALAPPHQGIDGEWSDGSGVIVYKWNEKGDRPNTGSINWKKRWSCCAEYDENANPCRRGWHVSYDDGFTLY